MKTILTLLFLTILTTSCFSQTTPQEITNNFFALYKQGDTDKALDFLFSKTPYVSDIAESIDDVKRQLKKVDGQMGKYNGADLLTSKTAGANIIMFTYLVRYDKQPLVFNITYYKPNDKWQMHKFQYAGSIEDELEEASKAYRLKENYD